MSPRWPEEVCEDKIWPVGGISWKAGGHPTVELEMQYVQTHNIISHIDYNHDDDDDDDEDYDKFPSAQTNNDHDHRHFGNGEEVSLLYGASLMILMIIMMKVMIITLEIAWMFHSCMGHPC